MRCGPLRLGRPSAPRARPRRRLGWPWAWRGRRVIGVWSLALIRWLSEYAKLSKWLRGGGVRHEVLWGVLPGGSAARRWGSAGRRGWWVAARRAATAGSSSPVAASTRCGGQGLDAGLPGLQVAAGVGHRLGVDLHVQDVRRHIGLDRQVGWSGGPGCREEGERVEGREVRRGREARGVRGEKWDGQEEERAEGREVRWAGRGEVRG